MCRPGCQADDQEPNDASGSATSTGTFPFTDYGLSICTGDVDWYSRDLDAGDILDITVTFEDDQGDLDVEVYEPISAAYVTGAYSFDDDETLTYTAADAGVHWFRVYMWSDSGDSGQGYDLDVDSY